MNIAALVKPVPDSTEPEYSLSESRILREKYGYLQNADDAAVVEMSLRLKEQYGGEVDLITMADEKAEEMLRDYLAMGADRAIRISGEELKGSDGLVTARVLVSVLRKKSYDVILAGIRSADGKGGQIGPRIAQALQLPCITHIAGVGGYSEGKLLVRKRIGNRMMEIKVTLPAVLTIQRHAAPARLASVHGILEAMMKEIVVYSPSELGFLPEQVGYSGSSIRIHSVSTHTLTKTFQKLEGTPEEIAEKIIQILLQHNILERRE
ncbi:MAG: electron transfer flavoprotein subunit beta/FixA family protein [bacterium JZ-2024 1]